MIDDLGGLPSKVIDTMSYSRDVKNVLKNVRFVYHVNQNVWSIGHGESKFIMTQLGLSRKKADALVLPVLDKLERLTKKGDLNGLESG
jgi:hypothetical protein